MAVTLGNYAHAEPADAGHTTTAATFPSATTAGRTLVLAFLEHQGSIATVTTPSGWTLRVAGTAQRVHIYTKVASGSETTVTVSHTNMTKSIIFMGELSAGATYNALNTTWTNGSAVHPVPDVS